MIARTTWGRALAVWMSVGLSQVATPALYAAPAAREAAPRHVVDQGQVARRLLESARTRDERVKLFQEALATPDARSKARSLGADPDRLLAAVPHLSDQELAELAARATQVRDVAAGHGGGGDSAVVLVGVLLLLAGIVVIAAATHDSSDDGYWDDCWCY